MTMKLITRNFTIKKINISSLENWSSLAKARIDIIFLSLQILQELSNNIFFL